MAAVDPQISELRVVIDYQSGGGAMRTLTLDIVDYPGEWLLDLPLLGKSYEQWSSETLAYLRRTTRPPLPAAFLERVAAIDPLGPADEYAAIEAARLFTDHLQARRQAHQTLSMIGPGRFLMPGDLAGSPALTFAPLALPGDGEPSSATVWAMMRRRYDSYRDAVVRPFFRDHFARLDRQIVLVDVLAALDAGPAAMRDLQDAMVAVLECFRVVAAAGSARCFRPVPDRILFAATKPISCTTPPMIARSDPQTGDGRRHRGAGDAGAEVDVIALAAVRADPRSAGPWRGWGAALDRGGRGAGEWTSGQNFDGTTRDGVLSRRSASGQHARRRFPLDPLPAAGPGKRPTTASPRCPTFASTARCNS